MYKIMVLNDGRTFSGVEGCRILAITDTAHEILCEGGEVDFLQPKHILFEEEIDPRATSEDAIIPSGGREQEPWMG